MPVLLIETAILVVIFGFLVTAVLVERSGLRARGYRSFEAKADISQRLTLAGFALFILEVIIGAPFIGVFLAVLAVAWTISWLPASHRRFEVVAQAVFEAPPEAVAVVMFDASQQPQWMDSVVSAKLTTPGLLRVGSVILQTIRLHGHELTAKLEVTELVPYERLVLAVDVQHARLFDRYEVLPHERGSLVRSVGVHELPRVNAVLNGWRFWSPRNRFSERRAANLERLRAIVARTAHRSLVTSRTNEQPAGGVPAG